MESVPVADGPAPLGLVHGRFQPLHLGHLEYIEAGKALCRKLIVGITSPDPWTRGEEPTAPSRSERGANPCTYYERHQMIATTLRSRGLSDVDFEIVPFPHSYPERLVHYAPLDAVAYLTVYDAWGREKVKRLASLGFRVVVLWEGRERSTSGTEVRARIRQGNEWTHLVPSPTVAVLERFGIVERIRSEPAST